MFRADKRRGGFCYPNLTNINHEQHSAGGQSSYRLSASGGASRSHSVEKMMGQKPVAARLDLLPDAKLSRGALLTSTVFQVGLAAFLVALPMFFPQKLVTQIMYEVTPIAAPETAVALPPKPPVVRARVQPHTAADRTA